MRRGILWSKEQDQALATLWEARELNMREIGEVLGMTKDRVAGRLYRLGLQRKPSGPRDMTLTMEERKNRKREKDRLRKRVRVKKQLTYKKQALPWKPKPFVSETTVSPISRNVPFIARQATECAYIVEKRTCCGATTKKIISYGKVVNSSWCSYHYDKVFIKRR